MKKNFKKIVVSSLAMVMVASTVALTAPKITKKQIPATFGKVNVTVDGENVTNKVEGFISNGTTYMPLRAISNVFGYNVNWNPATDMATLTSTGDNVALLKQQITMKDLEIARLKAELDKKESSSSNMSIRDLESQLIKDYKDFERIDLRINLRGDDRRTDLEIDVDLGRSSDRDRWDDIRESTIERLIEDMVRDIQREYRDADVSGYIRDTDAREDLYTFEKRGSRSIEINRKGKSNASTSTMERDLEKEFSYINKKNKDFEIHSFTVKEDSRNKYIVDAKTKNYYDSGDLGSSDTRDFYKDVKSFVEDNYRDAKVIEINIKDKDNKILDWKGY